MNKAFWSHFKHFGRPDLLGSFPANESPDITGQFGCGHRAKFSPSVGGKGGGGISQIAHTSYSRHQRTNPLRHAELFISKQKFYLLRIYYFFQISQLASCLKNRYFKEQIHCVPLKFSTQLYMFLLALAFKIDEKAFNYEHYPSILVSFLGKTEHFSRENGAF